MEPQKVSGELNRPEKEKILTNFGVFMIPIVVMYLTSVSAIMSIDRHVFNIYDLIPGPMVVGAMIAHISNTLIDIKKKLDEGVVK